MVNNTTTSNNIIVTDKYVMELKDLLSTSQWVQLEYKVSILFTIGMSCLFIYMLYNMDKKNNNNTNDTDDDNNSNTIIFNGQQNHNYNSSKGTVNDNNNNDNSVIGNIQIDNDNYLEVEKDNNNTRTSNHRIDNNNINSDNMYPGIQQNNNINNNKQSRLFTFLVFIKHSWKRLTMYTIQLSIMILFSYLLLVYTSSETSETSTTTSTSTSSHSNNSNNSSTLVHTVLSFIGIVIIWIVLMIRTIQNELQYNNSRKDRICILITIYLLLTCGLCYVRYSYLIQQEGQVYAGPARIIAYDAKTQYNNTDGKTIRSNIKVTWGGNWGCSENSNSNTNNGEPLFCVADVNATLCETSYNIQSIEKQYVASNEEWDEYIEQYNEKIAADEVKYNEQYNNTISKGYSGIAYNITNQNSSTLQGIYYSGENGEDVYMYQNGTVDTVVIAYKDTNEQIQIQKNISSSSNNSNVQVDFTNTNTNTNTNTTGSGKEKYIQTSVNPNTATSGSSHTKNGNNNNRQLNDIDDIITKTTEEEQVDEQSEQTKEDNIQQMGTNEINTYNEIVTDYISTELIQADTTISDNMTLEQVQQQQSSLIKENTELQTIVTALTKKYNAEIETENELESEEQYYNYNTIEEEISNYGYDNTYWNSYDWNSVWGSYDCTNMFNYDLQDTSHTYNPYVSPDHDTSNHKWPTINIYGQCNTCTAYIMDYYTTIHFTSIHNYKKIAYNYLLLSILSSIISLVFYIQYRTNNNAYNDEHKLVLLSDDSTTSHSSSSSSSIIELQNTKYNNTTHQNRHGRFSRMNRTNGGGTNNSTNSNQQLQLSVIA